MDAAGEEVFGLYREGDPGGLSGVAGLRGLFGLPEALGADHDGKATVFVDHPDPSPDQHRPARRTEKALRESEGCPSSTPYAHKSLWRSHQQPKPALPTRCAPGSCIKSSASYAPRQTSITPRLFTYLVVGFTLSADKRSGASPRRTKR